MTHPCRPLLRSIVLPRIIGSVLLLGMGFGLGLGPGLGIGSAEAQEPIKHSYLVMGAKTAILGEDGNTTWEYSGGSRDGFVLPNGNVLLAFSNRVEEVTPDKQIVFRYQLSSENKEIGTAERLYNGNTLVTELGPKPRLLEVDPQGAIATQIPLEQETYNANMQTRMARQLLS